MVYKQAILIRTDLDMSCGKKCAQCSHASIEAALKSNKRILDAWRSEGAKKVVLKVNSEKELLEFHKKAKGSALIIDAGYTELEAGTITCLGIGPDLEKKIDRITGKLKAL